MITYDMIVKLKTWRIKRCYSIFIMKSFHKCSSTFMSHVSHETAPKNNMYF